MGETANAYEFVFELKTQCEHTIQTFFPSCHRFRPTPFRPGGFLSCRDVRGLGYLVFLKAFAYFRSTDNTKSISTTCFEDMHKYNIILAVSELGMNSTDDLRIISENFGMEVLHKLNAVKHVIKNVCL
jgi:hypothetical protein